MRTTIPLLATISLAAAVATPAPAVPLGQGPGSGQLPAGPAVMPDSQELHRELRSRQFRFERLRRRNLSWTRPSSGRCDERIGRFCLRLTDVEDWVPPEERAAVRNGRTDLLSGLDSAARFFPGDAWLAGQRVRYLVEAERPEGALAAAADCRAHEYWWCLALAGYALHVAGAYTTAERAFQDAFTQMPEEERCRWTDLSRILEGKIRNRYRELPCDERDSLAARILWLADPFYSVPGNELLTEHFSRHVHSRLLRRSESPEGDRWGNDVHRFVMRYGWPYGWERAIPYTSQPGRESVISHFGRGAKYFFPKAEFLDDPSSIRDDDWELDPSRPKAGHSPMYASSSLEPLPHQLAIFRRGDSAVVVTAYRLEDDSIPLDAQVQAAMVVAEHEASQRLMVGGAYGGKTGVLALTVPAAPQLMSLEVLAPDHGRGARARYGLELRPSEGLELSDLLITHANDSLPDTLPEAIALARSSTDVRAGERLGLYWEVYGIGPDPEVLVTSLALTKRGKSIFRRAVQVFGLASDKPPVSLSWEDVSLAGVNMYPRAVTVDLPENISNGRYLLHLRVLLADGRWVGLEKELRLVDRE